MLIDLGVLDLSHAGDLFSLIQVYLKPIETDVDEHFLSVQQMKKFKSTKNPDYPSGMFRRIELFTTFKSYVVPLSTDRIEELRTVGREHFADNGPSMWEIDPIETHQGRHARGEVMHALSLRNCSLSETYVAHRQFTRMLVDGATAEVAAKSAVDVLFDFKEEVASLSESLVVFDEATEAAS